MDFIANQTPQIDAMLAEIGIKTVDELFQTIPEKLRHPRLAQDDGLSEFEGLRLMEGFAAKNTFPTFDSYLGAGAYEHHVPALVGAVCGKSEFLTSYTPYQAEASQGMLQAIFEFQSAVCALTGMDVSNASVYDGGAACAEAVLMSLRRHPARNKLVIAKSLNPHYRRVVNQYLIGQSIEIAEVGFLEDGSLDLEETKQKIDAQTAAVLVQYPNFFGGIDDMRQVSHLAKSTEALFILCANPLVYGLFASAAELGADIAVGDCQPLGLPLHFGGPYAGYMSCRQDLVRQLPGRLVGETVDRHGQRGFVLTLQAREQHIRREKATSNICTNQALAALASLVAMLWYGKEGMKALALTNYQRAAYLKQRLKESGVEIISQPAAFNEFSIRFNHPIYVVQDAFRSQKIEPGVDLGRYFPSLSNCLLVAVTETKSQEQLDHYVRVAQKVLKG